MNVFELFASLALDTSAFENGLNGALGTASSFGDKLKSGLSTAAKAGAAAIAAATAAVGAFAKSSLDAGMQFDSTMSQVSAISGATGEDFDALREKAIEMGASTKFSATESAEAFTYMAMAGWKTGDMLDGISGIMSLAAASGENLGTTSDIVTDALTAFGLAAEDSGHFADILAAASNNANTNVSMLGESFKYVAPVAGSLQYSAEDTAIALGLMANSGIKASQAGTALRTVLTNMAKPTDDMAWAMDALGVSLDDGEGNMYSFMEIMQQLRTSFGDGYLSMEEFQEGLVAIQEAYDSGETDFEHYVKRIEQLTIAMYGTEGAQKAQLAATLAGKEGMSGLLAIVNASQEDFDKLTDAIYSSSETLVKTTEGAIIPMSQALEEGLEWVEEYSGTAEAMAAVMQDNLAGSITFFNSALETAKITLSDQLVPALQEFVKFGTKSVEELTTAYKDGGLSGLMDAFGDVIANGVSMITEVLPQAVDAGAGLLGAVINGIVSNLPALANATLTIAQSLASSIAESAPQIMTSGSDLLTQIYNGILEGLPILANGAVEIMGKLGQYLQENLPVLLEAGLKALVELTGSIRENAGLIVDGAIALAKSLAKGLADSIPTIIENVPTIVSNIANTINDNAPKIFAAAVEIIGTLIKGIIRAIPTLVANVPQIISAIWDTITAVNWITLGGNIIKGIGGGIKEMVQFAKESINTITEALKNGVSSLPQAFKDIGKNVIQGLINGIKSMATSAINSAKEIGTSVVSGVKNVLGIHSPSTVFKEIGNNSVLGMINGWKEKIADFKTTVVNGVRNVLDAASSIIKTYNGVEYDPNIDYAALMQSAESLEEFQELAAKRSAKIAGENINLIEKGYADNEAILEQWRSAMDSTQTQSETTIEKTVKTVSDAVETLIDKGPDMGREFIKSLIDGIEQMDSALNNAIVNVVDNAVNAAISRMKDGLATATIDYESSSLAKSSSGFSDTFKSAVLNMVQPITIPVQTVLDGKVIGETAYKYNINRQKSYGG